jgi:hypothetical protein
MKRAELILGIFLLLFSMFIGYQCTLIESGTEFGMGPAFLPFWLSVGLGITSAIFLVQAIVLPARKFEPAFCPDRAGGLRVLLVSIAYLVSIALMKPLGIPLALGVIAATTMPVLGARNWKVVAVTALLTPLVIWAVFGRLLNVALHMGVLEGVLPLY